MKKQIRRSVFETNSSSSHSLTLDTENFVMDTSLVPKDGIVIINRPDGEFGWEWFKHNDAYTKALYAIIDGCEDLVRQAIHQQLGAFLTVKEGGGEYSWLFGGNGYIDHDSVGNVRCTVNTVDKMVHFIFNKNSWLFGGNDNSDVDGDFYNTPFFDKDGVSLGLDHIFKINFLNLSIEKEVSKNITELGLEAIMSNHMTGINNYPLYDSETGRKYSDWDFNLEEKTITFKCLEDEILDSHITNWVWEEKNKYLNTLSKTVNYEISKR